MKKKNGEKGTRIGVLQRRLGTCVRQRQTYEARQKGGNCGTDVRKEEEIKDMKWCFIDEAGKL